METRNTDATGLRPEGARIIDAPLVKISISEYLDQIKTEDTWQNSDRNSIVVFKTDGLRIVLVALHEGAIMKKHSAQGNISVQVLDGEIEFSTDNQSIKLNQAEVVALHTGIPHSVRAIKESVFLLTLTTSSSK